MEKLASLAKLDIDNESNLIKDIEDVIKMAGELKDVDCELSDEDAVIELRCDSIKESFEREQMLENAPCKDEGYIIVPTLWEEAE